MLQQMSKDFLRLFREVAKRLPIVRNILESAKKCIEDRGNDASYKGMQDIMQACEDKATKLDSLFRKVVPDDGTTTTKLYFSALQTLSKGAKVENLMKGMLEDMQLLVSAHSTEIVTKVQAERIEKAITEIALTQSSVSEYPTIASNYLEADSRVNDDIIGDQHRNLGNSESLHARSGKMIFPEELLYIVNPASYSFAGTILRTE